MQLRQLEYLVALAREQHFARAAASCFVTQPTLSDGIRRLENELGVPIVRRGHHYEGLTPEGERVLAFARRLIHEHDELLGELGPSDEHLSGRLRLGAIPTSLPPLPLLTAAFLGRYEHVDLTVLSLSSAEIARMLTTFELDAGLTYLDGEPIDHVRTLPLYEERHLLLAASDLLPELTTAISWGEAAQLPLCLLTRDMQHRRIVERLFLRAGAVLSPRVETNSISTLLSYVRSGTYASVVPQTWLYPTGVPEGMRILRFSEGDEPSTIGLVWLDADPEPLLARALLGVVRALELQPALDVVLARAGTDPERPAPVR